ncbi:MAG: molybdate ABC transporter substrate-binding protein [Chloroflexota bacterium]
MPNQHRAYLLSGLSIFLVIFLTAFVAIRSYAADSSPGSLSSSTERIRIEGDNIVGLAPANLSVFAAASLTEAFRELGQRFEEQHPQISITFNFAGSQQLAQQLAQGAPADLFASANQAQMNLTLEAERVDPNSITVFTHNRLAVISRIDNQPPIQTLSDLAKPQYKLILAANEVPAGQYAQGFLEKTTSDHDLGPMYQGQVLNNVVSYEANVKAVLTKIVLGEADAGIVYQSDIAAKNKDHFKQIVIPNHLNIDAPYPLATISDSQHPTQAAAFAAYVLSPVGQQILENHGFLSQ